MVSGLFLFRFLVPTREVVAEIKSSEMAVSVPAVSSNMASFLIRERDPSLAEATGPDKDSEGPEKDSAGPEKDSAGPEKNSAGPEKNSAEPKKTTDAEGPDDSDDDDSDSISTEGLIILKVGNLSLCG